MGYVLLAGAIAAEIAATTAMKYSEGFTRLWPSLVTLCGYVVSYTLLSGTLRTMSVGTAYAIWAGAGTAVMAVIGVLFLHESVSPVRLAGVGLVIVGVVFLNLGGSSSP
ncbi:DMT family transporter [Streptomyces fuscigenes]|uniref:DMT family transporter n=1 Tax=Streptomyces fuscigenes TaxID=1528880 RepID=UPI001F4121B6|nr:multidrug efflux SMR transporter [Streptomyces fuscigenes]MCF3962010.1 multidrug efflux SMR transporter [Streptomyces fuscigenes]